MIKKKKSQPLPYFNIKHRSLVITKKNKKKKKTKFIGKAIKAITEADKEHENWYKDAKHQTLKTLPKFLNHIIDDYAHDYGTICHAIAAAALGAANAIDNSNQGGITGFQASATMWEFIRHWKSTDNPLSLVDFGDMLYPQYEGEFQKTISQDTADWLKKTAQEFINNNSNNNSFAIPPSPTVLAHWKKLAAGKLPFDYTIKKP